MLTAPQRNSDLRFSNLTLKYSFGRMKTGIEKRGRNSKLHKAEVADIRAWAKREGAGMPRLMQVETLLPRYTGLTARSLHDVLCNLTWYDPTYDPNAVVEPPPLQAASLLVSMPWLFTLLLMWQMFTVSPASRVATPQESVA